MTQRAPVIYATEIKPEWLDYNNHMNVAYYVLVFDLAGEQFICDLGLGEEVTRETGISWMVLENHITYDNEVILGQEIEVRLQIMDHDNKRLHLYFEMFAKRDDGEEYLASTLEQMAMCVDLNKRKSSTFPNDVAAKIEELAESQTSLSTPANIGRTIGIRRK